MFKIAADRMYIKLLFFALLLITCESYAPPSARSYLKSCALKPLQPQHHSLSASLKWRDGDVSTSMAETTDDEDGMRMTFMMRVRRKINAVFQLKEPGALILIRHGETNMNYNKTFTGWIDTDLSDRGVQEMFYAARLLLERGYTVDATYTSRLKRAIRSSWIMYSELGCVYRPVYVFCLFYCSCLRGSLCLSRSITACLPAFSDNT
jgi:hypothetical protein